MLLTCPAEKQLTLPALESLQIPHLPPPLKSASSDIYPSFLSGFFNFFCLTWAMVTQFSTLLTPHHCLQFGLDLESIWPDKGRCCACRAEGHWPVLLERGGCQKRTQVEWLTLLRHAPWLWLVVLIPSGGFLQIKLQPLGGATDSGFLHSWPVSYSTVRS